MPEPAGASPGPFQGIHRDKLCFLDPGKNQLCDPIATIDRERLITEIEQDDPYLASIVSVDRAGAVQHANAVLEREPAPRPHLSLMSLRDGNSNPGGDELPRSRIEYDLTFHGGIEIDARGMLCLVMRNRKAFRIIQLRKVNNKMIGHFYL